MKITINALLIGMLLFLASGMYAQNPLTFGVKGGVNFSDFSKDIEDNKIKVGFNAGVTADYKLSKNFYLLTGLEVISKGTREVIEFTFIDIGHSSQQEDRIQWNPIYLSVPLHVGYKVYATEDVTVLFHVGPYVSYGIAGKVTKDLFIDGEREKEKVDAFGGNNALLKRWDFGLGLGTGIEFQRMGLNFGYDLGVLNISKETNRSLKTNNAHISLSYRFQ